jgi:hypothetical protein
VTTQSHIPPGSSTRPSPEYVRPRFRRPLGIVRGNGGPGRAAAGRSTLKVDRSRTGDLLSCKNNCLIPGEMSSGSSWAFGARWGGVCLFTEWVGPSVSMNHGVEGGVAPVMLREVNARHDEPATARRVHRRTCMPLSNTSLWDGRSRIQMFLAHNHKKGKVCQLVSKTDSFAA